MRIGRTMGKSKAGQALAEKKLNHRSLLQIVNLLVGLVRTGMRCGTALGIAYFAYKGLEIAAGKETILRATVEFLADIRLWIGVSWGGVATIAWYRERRLRHRTIVDSGSYIKELELKVDPKRSSSKLTHTGQPRKEDADASI
jgi:hypothetical protein